MRSAAVLQRLGFSLANPLIGDALTGDALEHVCCALAVVEAQRRAVVIAKIELREIAERVALVAALTETSLGLA